MTKQRVYEVARDLGLDNRELINRMAALGIQVRNHMSSLDASEIERVKRALNRDRNETLVEEKIRPNVVRRRAKKVSKEEPKVVEARSSFGPPPDDEDFVDARPKAPVPERRRRAAVSEQRTEVSPESPPAEQVSVEPPPVVPAPKEEVQPQAESAPVEEPIVVDSPPVAEAQATPGPEPEQAPSMVGEEQEPADETPSAQSKDDDEARPSERDDTISVERGALPPGVIGRGRAVAPGAAPLSEEARQRIVSEHAARNQTVRRRELGRAALGQAGRGAARKAVPRGKRRMAPGKKAQKTEITVPSAAKRLIRIEENVQLQTLAQRMSLKATDVLMKLMQLGMGNVHINSTLDEDTAKIIAGEFGYEVENVAQSEEEIIEDARGTFENDEKDQIPRPPIITVMGHVDHGKTSLLDRIRKTSVASGEKGGITQHIGSYRVELKKGTLVFLDTPGHAAFTSMRARGAEVTDVVILVCAADDGLMPQTKEAISHAKAANVPMVVAVNKIDKEDAKPEQVRTQLAGEGVQPEEWGGEVPFVNCSAVTGEGIDELLEAAMLQAEMLELKANPKIPAEGIVIETYLDKGRGPVANVLIKDGSLSTGEFVVAGSTWGRVRAMTDDRGKQLKVAKPGTPVELLGLSDMPSVGDHVYAVTDQKKAQEVADSAKKPTNIPSAITAPKGLDQLQEMMRRGEIEELKLVVKADVQGSVEALVKALTELSTDKVEVKVIHTGVGGITDNDVMLASASEALVLGFNVRPVGQAGSVAKKEGVDIRMYGIIYEAVDEVKKAMAGLLAPTLVEKEMGKVEVREIFHIPKVGTIAGCYVTDGKITRKANARLVRDGIKVWEGKLASLKRFKDDVREVSSGYECGLSLEGFNDIKERDVVEAYDIEEVAATL